MIKNMIKLYLIIACASFLASCSHSGKKVNDHLNQMHSDAKAISMAHSMMDAMGGQKKWDQLHYVSWTFFGNRHLVWDKIGGKVRIEIPKDTSIYLLDINKMTGKVMRSGKEIIDVSQMQEELKKAKGMWINDSYWLFMPFKLLDNGVTLKYIREDTIMTGEKASVLQLTFDQVGNTPENKYEVYVDKDHLIKQWSYFKISTQIEPPRTWPWDNYKSYNGLMLSAERSDKSGPSNVRVYDQLNNAVFESFNKFDFY